MTNPTQDGAIRGKSLMVFLLKLHGNIFLDSIET